MVSDEATRISLEPNRFSLSVIAVPLAGAVAVIVVGVGASLVLAKGSPEARDMIMTTSLLGGLIAFYLVRRFTERRFVLALSHGDVALIDAKSGSIVERGSPGIEHGYFYVSSKGGGGYVPAISFAFPDRATLTVAPKDLENYYFWAGDDPWSRSYSRRTDMPFATSFVAGREFVTLARLAVRGDTLIGRRNGS
jgi:hypothetical protein